MTTTTDITNLGPDAITAYIEANGGVPQPQTHNQEQMLPAGIILLTEPIPPVEFTVITDSYHPNVKKCIVVQDEGADDFRLDIFLPEGWSLVKINDEGVRKLVDKGLTQWSVKSRVLTLNYDPLAQRTCEYFTPSKGQQEEYGAIESEHYEFDRTHNYGICSNKAIKVRNGIPNPGCECEPNQAACDFYVPESFSLKREWKGVHTHTEEGEELQEMSVSIQLRTSRRGLGVPERQFTLVEGDSAVVNDAANIETEEDLERFLQSAREHYNFTEPLEEVPVYVQDEHTDKYFDYVLSS